MDGRFCAISKGGEGGLPGAKAKLLKAGVFRLEAPAVPAHHIPMPGSAPLFPFENTYARLPSHFHALTTPTPVSAPRLLQLNAALAHDLNLDPDALRSPEGVAVLAGNAVAPGSEPLAIAYAGHQFGSFVPQLGDGRANLLGEVRARDGHLYDIQLKGSGPTPFSRRGDGRAALGPVLREYLVSEAMHALGVPSTRSLAAVSTGEVVYRETALPGAVLTRVAASHLRVGTFQYFAAQEDTPALRTLAAFAIARHYPHAATSPTPIRTLLDSVIEAQATLVAQWLCLGFIHGVMNTDNTSISGETIDFGPCAFLEAYDPAKVFSSIDFRGRYAFANQPHAAHWNLTRLAEALLPLLEEEAGSQPAGLTAATDALATFATHFEAAYLVGLRRKLGLLTERPEDQALAQDLLDRMATNRADFTLTFSRLTDAATSPEHDDSFRRLFDDPAAFDTWASTWRARLAVESAEPAARAEVMRRANPTVIPRNHLVEAAIRAAVDRDDLQPFQDLLAAVTTPFTTRPTLDRYTTPALPEQCVTQTFCGT